MPAVARAERIDGVPDPLDVGREHLRDTVAELLDRSELIGAAIAAGTLGGFDSLLSTVMMPPGMPVATVAVGGAENAGLLAAQIIAVGDAALAARVEAERETRRRKVLESDAEVRAQFGRGASPAAK